MTEFEVEIKTQFFNATVPLEGLQEYLDVWRENSNEDKLTFTGVTIREV